MALAAAGCAGGPEGTAGFGPATATFLTDDLVQVTLVVPERSAPRVVRARTDCAAAEAIVLRGMGFGRHVRTVTVEEGGIRRADAVYSVSTKLPGGAAVIDAETLADACREQGQSGDT